MASEAEIVIKAKLILSIYNKDVESFKTLYSEYKDYLISISDSRINVIVDEIKTKLANMLGYYPEYSEVMFAFIDRVFRETDMFPDELKEYEVIMFKIKHGRFQHRHNLELIDQAKLIAPKDKKRELLTLELDEASETLDIQRINKVLLEMEA